MDATGRRIVAAIVLMWAGAGAPAAAQEAVSVARGETVTVALTTKVLVDSCDDGNPHSGPEASTFELRPEGAAVQLSPTPRSQDIKAGGAAVDIRVAAGVAPGTSIIANWTAVADGCYSANGTTTLVVSSAPAVTGATATTAAGATTTAPVAPGNDGGGSPAPVVPVVLVALLVASGAVVAARRRRTVAAAPSQDTERPDRDGRPDAWDPTIAGVRAALAAVGRQLEEGSDGSLAAVTLAMGELGAATGEGDALVKLDDDLAGLAATAASSTPMSLASLASGVHALARRCGQPGAWAAASDGLVATLDGAGPGPVPPAWTEVGEGDAELLVAAVAEARACLGLAVAGGSMATDTLAAVGERVRAGAVRRPLADAARRERVVTAFRSGVERLEVTARLLTEPEALLLERALEVGTDRDRLRSALGRSDLAVRLEARLQPWRGAAAALGQASPGPVAVVCETVRGTPSGLRDVVVVASAAGLDPTEFLGSLRDGLHGLLRSPLDLHERLSAQVDQLPAVRRMAAEHADVLRAVAARCRRACEELDRAAGIVRGCEVLGRVDEAVGEVDRGLAALETILAETAARSPALVTERRQQLAELRVAVEELFEVARSVASTLGGMQRSFDRVTAVLERLAAMQDDPVLLHPEATSALTASRDLLLAAAAAVVASAAGARPAIDWSGAVVGD